MQLPIRFYLICTFLCAPFFSRAQVALGDSLYYAADFQRAVIAYEYAVYKGVVPEASNSILLKSAYCYKQLNRPDQALRTLDGANYYTGSDSSRFLLFYEYALNALLAEKYDLAFSKIQELRYEVTDTSLFATLLPLEVIALNELQRWPEAHTKYLQLMSNELPGKDPYDDILTFKKKNPDKAMALSYWLPGVGQMYAGYFWKGFVSSALNVGLIGFSAWSFINGFYFSGAFTGVALFYLSYNGGARYAEVLANQYNEEKIRRFNERVRGEILSRGIK